MLVAFGFIGAVLMGITLGLLGGGGSILTVPILVYLLGIPPVLATAYSLFVVGLSSLIGGVDYMRKKEVNLKVGVAFALPGLVGVFLTRRYVVPFLPEKIFDFGNFILTKDILIMLSFAVIMILASFSMIRKKKNNEEVQGELHFNYFFIALEGILIGGITGFVGAGGGFLIVPALVVLVNLPMKEAIGTSLIIIGVKSLFGFLGDLNPTQQIDWQFLAIFSILSLGGIVMGSYLTKYVSDEKLKPIFGWFVLIAGGMIFAKEVIF